MRGGECFCGKECNELVATQAGKTKIWPLQKETLGENPVVALVPTRINHLGINVWCKI